MFPDPNSRSASLFERAKKTLPGGLTRFPAKMDPYPVYIDDASGCHFIDADGEERIDFINNFSSLIHGHAHPEIVEVIREQVGKVSCSILPSEHELRLSELIVERMPGVDKVRFLNTGTEAVMVALKVARAHTGRGKIMKMEGGYHGQVAEMEMSFITTPDNWGKIEEPNRVHFSAGTIKAYEDSVIVGSINRTEVTRNLIRKYANEMAAVILDPFPSHMNFIDPDHKFLQMLREETEKLGIVLIFDEVYSARLSYSGAQGRAGVTPDLTVMGKIFGGGLPIGVVGGSNEVMKEFTDTDSIGIPRVFQGGTFSANPLSMVAGYTAMKLMTSEAYAQLDRQGERLREGLRTAAENAGIPVQVMGAASLTGLVLASEPFDSYRELMYACGPQHRVRMGTFHKHLLNEGVLISPQGVFVGSMPMTNNDIDFTVAAAEQAFLKLLEEERRVTG